jgi:hypothetical protein
MTLKEKRKRYKIVFFDAIRIMKIHTVDNEVEDITQLEEDQLDTVGDYTAVIDRMVNYRFSVLEGMHAPLRISLRDDLVTWMVATRISLGITAEDMGGRGFSNKLLYDIETDSDTAISVDLFKEYTDALTSVITTRVIAARTMCGMDHKRN